MEGVSVASLIAGLVSGVISSVLTYFSTRSKIRLEMRVDYDKKLHETRLELYKQLWPKTESLARYSPAVVLTYSVVKKVAEDMRDWYFETAAGIYLSKRSRKPYFELKKRMQRVIDDELLEARPDDPINEEVRMAILTAATRLRTSLADDIGMRRGPWL
jgi:hypothetical protein